MRPTTPSLHALRAFEAAARHQSFSRAAEELFVTPGAISQQIAALEADLGLLLFNRVKQRLELTDAGKSYLVPLKESLDRIESATVDLLHHGGSGGELQVGVLPSLASYWLIPRLPDFARRHPGVRLSLSTLNVNFASADRSPNLEGGFIDVGLFYGDGHWDRLTSDLLLREVLVPVAAPALLQGQSLDGDAPADLFQQHPLLQHSTRPHSWGEWFRHNGLPVPKPQGFSFEHFHMVIDAAKQGLGIAIVPRLFVERLLAKGELAEIPGQELQSRRAYYLVSDPDRAEDPKIQVFKAWVLEAAGRLGT
ncbi:LysR substrate-binding domain-containing protein [Rhodovibrionaceae bacterium A322]